MTATMDGNPSSRTHHATQSVDHHCAPNASRTPNTLAVSKSGYLAYVRPRRTPSDSAPARSGTQSSAARSETAPQRGSTRSRQRDQQRSQPSPRRVWPPSRRIGRAPYESVGPLPGRNVR